MCICDILTDPLDEGEAFARGPKKDLGAWTHIAWAVHFLHSDIYELTEFNDADNPRFMRDPGYRAGLAHAARRWPTLAALIRDAAKRRDLFWLVEQGDIERWAMCQPEVEAALADTTPSAIRALYTKLNGPAWKPTAKQSSIIRRKEAEAEAYRKRMLGDIDERIRMAEDVLSDTPCCR